MLDADRKTREEKVLETIREWLPELSTPGSVIQINALDPEASEGALFSVTKARTFICRR